MPKNRFIAGVRSGSALPRSLFCILMIGDVVAVSRRAPAGLVVLPRQVHPGRPAQPATVQRSLRRDVRITHLAYAAASELGRRAWRDRQMQTNPANPVRARCRQRRDPSHTSRLQGTKAYGRGFARTPPADALSGASQPRHQHENFYWLQEDYVRQAGQRWHWSVLPQLVIGEAIGQQPEHVAAVGTYAAIRAPGRAVISGAAHGWSPRGRR